MSAAPVQDLLARPRRRFRALLAVTTIGIGLVVLLGQWGNWRRFVLIAGLEALRVVCNALALNLRRPSRRRPFGLFPTINAAITLGVVHFAGWTFPGWLYVVATIEVVESYDELASTVRVAAWMLAYLLLALFDGVGWLIAVPLSLATVLLHALSGQRSEMVRLAEKQVQAARQQLVEQEKLSSLGMMAAGMAHELSNPMGALTSDVHFVAAALQRAGPLAGDLQECAEDVLPAAMENVERVNRIVSDLRRFARASPPEPGASFELVEEVECALRLASRSLAHCELERDLRPVPPVSGSGTQLAQVALSLLLNAAQATVKGGRVRVATSVEGERAVLVVADTGPGISPEMRAHLFEPFLTTRPPGAGAGLGLSVAHGIVAAHGGTVDVQSEPGKGSCFTVRLPVARLTPVPEARSKVPPG